jgi:ABC-type Mn2+/Zn2+ transport system ATPase subunit/ABC-type branched-subunit amino acid transport system permease subunit
MTAGAVLAMLRGRAGPRMWLPAVAAAALLAALVPAWLSPGDVTDVTLATTRGALAAAAAVALAVGRPSLAVAGLGGVAAYTSGYAAVHEWAVPLAMLLGVAASVVVSVGLGVVGARLGSAVFLALTLVAALAGGALVAALPDTLGGAAGLTGVPTLSLPLGGGDSLSFGPAGILHVALLLVAAAVVASGAVLLALPGARWRAIGGDRRRSADAGLRPLRGTLGALAVSGALAGLGGVLAVHATGVATPSSFSADAAVLPLLAALLAARGGPPAAALLGAAAGVVGLRLLPALGWTGPPGAEALATGVLAAVTLLAFPALLRSAGGRAAHEGSGGDAGDADEDSARDAGGRAGGGAGAGATLGGSARVALSPLPEVPWPSMVPRGGAAGLVVRGLMVRPGPGTPPLARLDLEVSPGSVHGLVGPNGAGKSTALRGVLAALRSGSAAVSLSGAAGARAVLLPQHGGGWPGCTVGETLRLAARAGGRGGAEVRRAAGEWSARLGLRDASGVLCERLSHGVRRRVELGRVLLLRPALLLCDEPLAGLDDADRGLVVDCLRAAAADGVTLLVAEHDRASLVRIATATTELRPLQLGEGGAEPEPAPA